MGPDINVEHILDGLYKIKDKDPRYAYVVVNKAMHDVIAKYLFGSENKYKARIEELCGMKYMVSGQFEEQEELVAYVSALDIGKIAAVYTDFEGNAVMIEDLINSIKIDV